MPPPSSRSKNKPSKKPHILHSGLRPTCQGHFLCRISRAKLHGVQGVGVDRSSHALTLNGFVHGPQVSAFFFSFGCSS
jgi:hypothetical protein